MKILIAIMVLILAPVATAGEFVLGPAAVFSGEATMLTVAIGANACAASEVSAPAIGVLSTDVVSMSFQSDPSTVTGYGSGAADGLVVYGYPGSDVVLFKVCNVTGTSITPGAMTINWQVAK